MKPLTGLSHQLSYYLYAFLQCVLRCCHVRIVSYLGIGIGYIVWMCFAARRRIVARNLRIVIDPMLRPAELRPLVRRNIVLTCMNFACALKVGLMSQAEADASIRMVGKEIFEDAGSDGKTAIACIPHAGNWEVLARIRPYFTKVDHFASMYRKLRNPLLEKIVYKTRTYFGCEMFSKESGLRPVLRMVKGGGLLGVLSDQFTQEGLFVPYFGKVTGTTPLPASLRQICKGSLFAVFTRNTSPGKWDAVLGTKITLETNAIHQEAADTIAVNLALENNQREQTLDGFWMHHRWKITGAFAPPQAEGVDELAAQHTRLPFRIIVALPESLDEALQCIPALRLLKRSRHDAQLLALCPQQQAEFWSTCTDLFTHVISTDSDQSVLSALDADEIYADGPFDICFMLNENRNLLRKLSRLAPLGFSGLTENTLASAFQYKGGSSHCGPPRQRCLDYLAHLHSSHMLCATPADLAPLSTSPAATGFQGTFIAPISQLGTANQWPLASWEKLCTQLPGCRLLALSSEEAQARPMAEELGMELVLLSLTEIPALLGAGSEIIAVDNLLAQLATLSGARCTVLMASRLAERYTPWYGRFRPVYHHSTCHPCYQSECNAARPCLQLVESEDVIAAHREELGNIEMELSFPKGLHL